MSDNLSINERALNDVRDERLRQITQEGWSAEHDDAHDKGELALAAGWYALNSVYRGPDCLGDVAHPECEARTLFGGGRNGYGAYRWPWDMAWWKPSTPRRDLVKAAALLIAEIERLDRKDSSNV